MKDRQSKKVVIINDIQSDAIERAIFILRGAGAAVKPEPYHIVTEAQNIINAYIQTVEKANPERRRRSGAARSRRTARPRRLFYAAAAAGLFLLAGWFLISCVPAVLSRF